MGGLCLLGRLDDVEVVLILSTSICILSCVQDLLLPLELLLKHDLGLLLAGTRGGVLESLGVASGSSLAVAFLTSSWDAAVVLG